MPITDRWLKIMFPIVILCAMLPWLGGYQRLTADNTPPHVVNTFVISEHPHYGFPPYGEYDPVWPSAWKTWWGRQWSDGRCEIAGVTYHECGTWTMGEWFEPEPEL